MTRTEEAYVKIASNIDKITELKCENDMLLWNEAIEQAAKIAETSKGYPIEVSENIRKLKI